MTILKEMRDASDVPIDEIIYGEIKYGIKEGLNIKHPFFAHGNDYPSQMGPVSVHPSLEQEPQGGIDLERICRQLVENFSLR